MCFPFSRPCSSPCFLSIPRRHKGNCRSLSSPLSLLEIDLPGSPRASTIFPSPPSRSRDRMPPPLCVFEEVGTTRRRAQHYKSVEEYPQVRDPLTCPYSLAWLSWHQVKPSNILLSVDLRAMRRTSRFCSSFSSLSRIITLPSPDSRTLLFTMGWRFTALPHEGRGLFGFDFAFPPQSPVTSSVLMCRERENDSPSFLPFFSRRLMALFPPRVLPWLYFSLAVLRALIRSSPPLSPPDPSASLFFLAEPPRSRTTLRM